MNKSFITFHFFILGSLVLCTYTKELYELHSYLSSDELISIFNQYSIDDLDILKHQVRNSTTIPKNELLLLASANAIRDLSSQLNQDNVYMQKHHRSLTSLIQHEREKTSKCHKDTEGWLDNLSATKSIITSEFFKCFREYKDILKFLNKVTELYPKIIRKFKISTTIEGESINAFKLSAPEPSFRGDLREIARVSKKSIYIQGMLHAREWLSPTTVMYVMSAFIEKFNANDSNIRKLLKHYDWYFVPIVNIDGYKYTWTSERMWRKNRRIHHDSQYHGVDLNRNYGPQDQFCKRGGSQSKWSQVYCGEYAFSEPEIDGIDKWMKTQPNIIASVDVHTYASSVYVPMTATELIPLAEAMRNGLNSVHTDYRYSRTMTTTDGTFKDSQYRMYSKRPSFTLELRGNGFDVDEIHIKRSGEENYNGFLRYGLHLLESL